MMPLHYLILHYIKVPTPRNPSQIVVQYSISLSLKIMSQYDQNEIPVAYPPPLAAYHTPPVDGYSQGPYVMPPPPIGYPTKDGHNAQGYARQHRAVETTSRGDDFWKGCFAAVCCCCVLDMCCC